MLPFGLDIKSVIVGFLLAWFVVPYIRGMLLNRSAAKAPTTVA